MPSLSPIPASSSRVKRPNRTFSGLNMSSSRASPASPGPIQVDSLSRIAQIAESPPPNFQPPSVRAATLDKYPRPSLVLYVVRVPGSRDLFLTTIHPLKSTVTAEDVLGCLYYVHVHGAEETSDGGGNGIPPGGARGGNGGDRVWNEGSGAQASGSGRKWSAHRIMHSISSASAAASQRVDDFRMTLVRRDPATTEQWNVAEIVSAPQAHGPPGVTGDGAAQGYTPSPISIELLTPGYRRFSEYTVRNTNRPLPPLPPVPRPPVPPLGRAVPPEQEEEYFRRKAEYNALVALHAEQVALSNANNPEPPPERPPLLRQVVYESTNSRASWLKAKVKRKVFNRSSSSSSSHHASSSAAHSEAPIPEADQGEDRWRGYVFDGLGDAAKCAAGEKCGRIRFKEMAGGRIMKCKYYPHQHEVEQRQLEPSYLVSAVEFKLPAPTNPLHGHRRSFSKSSARDDEDVGGLGFVEPAGVDETGKAKMGTFVVHEAGMQMLDLVVAANVGVFWKKWEGWKVEKGALGGM